MTSLFVARYSYANLQLSGWDRGLRLFQAGASGTRGQREHLKNT
jgi:hypothetical protein